MQCRDRRFRETTTKSGLGPTFKVTSSVVLWTSTRQLRNPCGCHPCNLKYRVGIVGLERRQQSTVLDRPLKHKCRVEIVAFERRRQSRVLDRPLEFLVQLSFGLRQENLEIFADAIHASINEQLIQIYDGIFGFKLKCRVGILGFERRKQSTIKMLYRDSRLRETTTKTGLGPTLTVTSSVELWTSTRELRNLRGCLPCKY
ncbi:hypothetical protein V1477_013469 [Vespula maculifrons]|uniref:Uncharacterized protein n=1 Tax=Vespula maculifrons TaxID=7453 RepID=A0ABD2BRM9_VESMC